MPHSHQVCTPELFKVSLNQINRFSTFSVPNQILPESFQLVCQQGWPDGSGEAPTTGPREWTPCWPRASLTTQASLLPRCPPWGYGSAGLTDNECHLRSSAVPTEKILRHIWNLCPFAQISSSWQSSSFPKLLLFFPSMVTRVQRTLKRED